MNKEIFTQIVFKEGQPEINRYMNLFNAMGWFDKQKISAEEMKIVLDNSWYMICAYHEDKLIGFGRLMSDGVIHAMIYEMIIEPEYQEIEIGKQILKLLVDKCNNSGIRDIQLFCAKGKKEFYLKNSFEVRPDDAPGMQYR